MVVQFKKLQLRPIEKVKDEQNQSLIQMRLACILYGSPDLVKDSLNTVPWYRNIGLQRNKINYILNRLSPLVTKPLTCSVHNSQ